MVTLRTAWTTVALGVALVGLSACGDTGGGSDACDDCSTPPAAACSGDTLYTFPPIGECADGQCIYPPTITDCPAGCEDAACVEVVDPCDEVTCDEVPDDACDGDTAVQYADGGVCDPDTGACEYTPRRTDCARNGLICVDGACEPVDPCDDVVCEDPPEPTCLNPGTVQTWGEVGTCDDDGECTYTPTNVSCSEDGLICSDGACVEEPPCFGDDCEVVAAPYCTGTVSVRAINGRCDDEAGVCVSDEERIDCALTGKVCEDGLCISDVACRGVVCDVPPESRCEGSRLVRYADEGICVAGEGTCDYSREVIACSDMGMTCQDGECVDASCLGVICAAAPDDVCDGDTLLTYAPRGVCEGGDCSYTPTEIDCTATGQRCDRGACVAPLPCDEVTCDETPEPYCVDDVLRVPSGGGICEDGVCRYGESIVDCGAAGQSCRDGACRDACFEVTCDAPPAGACDEDTAISFEPVGVCRPATGECEYRTVTSNCLTRGEVCIDGECVPDPCGEEVTCDVPPAGTCDENVAVIPFGAGICSRGTCAFAERRRDCTPEGLTCIDGDCRDACYGVSCDEPPVDWCDGDTRIHYPDDGTCNPETGGCRYRAASENCAADGLICLEGVCVEDPCDTGELTCDVLPEPTCDGDIEVVPFGDGLCERGACEFAERRTDCTVDGLTCIDGGCRDACYGVACDEPPAPACDGELLLTWADAGTCDPDDGTCSYRQSTRNCASDGLLCIDGACVEDPCDSITCDAPPAGVCEGDLLVEGFGTGTCARGECTYSFIRRNCADDGLSCVDGGCRDACYGVTCDAPPAPTCEGETLTTFADAGTCLPLAGGDCLYEATTTNCADTGQLCVDGACVDDPCDTITCEDPAPATCVENVVYEEFGVGLCERGECSYATRIRDCDDDGLTCIDGDCRDACYEVVCDEPPAPSCAEDVLLSYEDIGTCDPADASCSYTLVTTNCVLDDQLCIDGACVDDPCDTTTCDEPPASYCDGNTEVEPFGAGLCTRGDCSYAERRLNCDSIGETCIDGACRDACYGVTCDEPPATTCEGDTSVGFLDAGTCDPSTGLCSYRAVTTNCLDDDLICLGGECVPDPCLELTCDAPPAGFCDGDVEVVPFGIGTCDRGDCSYAERRTPCAEIGETCLDGACRDACYEVVCDAPPANSCVDETAFEYGPDSGTCRLPGGECIYEATITNCVLDGGVCFEGSCIPDPCPVGACDEPPAATCDGSVVVASLPGGVCTRPDGECVFDEARTDCAESGLVCRDGACVDACDGVTCDAPPAPTCEGVLLSEYALPGECNPLDGSCAYVVATTDCSETDQICRDGACVDNPCLDVVCDAPPTGVCDGDVLVTHPADALGVCSTETGLCSYPEVRIDCIEIGSLACIDGACVDRCDVLTCDTAPDPTCDGPSVRTYTAPGTCDPDVGCQYPSSLTDCPAIGLVCIDGACAEPGACFDVICDRPPTNLCEGNTQIRYAETGACADGVCSYPIERIDCGATDQFCVDGVCVDADPCADFSCGTVPAPECDLGQAVTYTFSGTCDPLGCVFDETVEPCLDGTVCLDGACIDACVDVTCDSPPAPICSGPRTGVAYDSGACELGTCLYEEAPFDCSATGQYCQDGECVDVDPCIGVVCDPPEFDPVCDGTTVLVADDTVCIGGACQIVFDETDCAETDQICVDATCVDDPCADVDCAILDPPPRDCEGEFIARAYSYSGICAEGTCLTEVSRTDCSAELAFGFCDAGFCVEGEPCVSDCSEVENFCEGTEAVVRDGGRCVGGVCEYSESREDCAAEPEGYCRDGACLVGDPCADVNCDEVPVPDPICIGSILTTFARPAECVFGGCNFTQTDTDCADSGEFCVDGACTATDPCDGIVCDTPPAPVCDGEFAISFPDTGVCEAGACTYESSAESCLATGRRCRDGVCVSDLCAGIDCTEAPSPYCASATQVVTPLAPGSCADGECVFDLATTDCEGGNLCSGGLCQAPIGAVDAHELVLNEVLASAAGWMELHNTTDRTIDLRGLTIEVDGVVAIEVAESVVVAAGGYALFADEEAIGILDPTVTLVADTDLSGILDATVTLVGLDAFVIDEVVVDASWPGTASLAGQRDPGATLRASTMADWCAATSEYAPALFGTPAASNFDCGP